jgi:hypothetical protein
LSGRLAFDGGEAAEIPEEIPVAAGAGIADDDLA